MKPLKLAFLILSLVLAGYVAVAQSRVTERPAEQKTAKPAEPQTDQPASDQEIETVKIDTNLVTVPVIANSRSGSYIADLKKEEFTVSEDGVAQQVAFFATVNAPFHVVLALDTSGSTAEKLRQIQQAAMAFVELLGPKDQVKVISFDSDVRDLNKFTSDKTVLRNVIKQTRTGPGTKLYDAVRLSLNALRPINQRRAIVLFTDGVDFQSDSETFESTVRDLDESGVIVYPIRFNTRAETERMVRKQFAETNNGQFPTANGPNDPFPDAGRPPKRTTLPTGPLNQPPPPDNKRRDDNLRAQFDQLYLIGDIYLRQLADRSGGQLYRADNAAALPQAFAAIAAELSTQYLLGYYPSNPERDGSYRKISVKTTRKDIAIRARPGYRARSGG